MLHCYHKLLKSEVETLLKTLKTHFNRIGRVQHSRATIDALGSDLRLLSERKFILPEYTW